MGEKDGRDSLIGELKGLIERQAARLDTLEGELRSLRPAQPSGAETRPARTRRAPISRAGLLKAATAGAVATVVAEVVGSAGAPTASAATFRATGGGPFLVGFECDELQSTDSNGNPVGDPTFGWGIYAKGLIEGVYGSSTQSYSTETVADPATADGSSPVNRTYPTGVGVMGTSEDENNNAGAGPGVGVLGTSGSGTAIIGISQTGTGVLAQGGTSQAGIHAVAAGVTPDAVPATTAVYAQADKSEAIHARNAGGLPVIFATTVSVGPAIKAVCVKGYGVQANGGLAPLFLVPATTAGHPTSGAHRAGELYVDSAGHLFYCNASGTPGTWVQLA